MKPVAILSLLLLSIHFAVCQTTSRGTAHSQKPVQSPDSVLSVLETDQLFNSDYAKSLDTLNSFVKDCRVINSIVGNAGFILVLDNKSWAAAFRVGDSISFAFGNNKISATNRKKITSTQLGDATEPIGKDEIYGTEKCNIAAELKKSHGRIMTGIAVGMSTFNFVFQNDMELDFHLVNDNKGKPAIRVFWEQW